MRPLSARNPRVQRLALLVKRRGERTEQRAFVVEGPVLVAQAVDAGLGVRDIYVDEGALTTRPAVADLLRRLPAEFDPWVLPPGVLDRIGDATTSQGVLAVVDQPDVEAPTPERTSFVVVLADLADPGNVGTLIRSAAAAGAGAVVVAGGVDPTNPKVVRASAGASFTIDVVSHPDPVAAVAELQDRGYRAWATVVRDGEPHDALDGTGPVAVVLGNEAHGLAAEVAAQCDHQVTVPMAGPTESLNVAMAGTVVCFEILRQRRAATSPAPHNHVP